MSRKVITLPNRDEMIERLVKVNDDSRLQERFYPILLKQAGQKYAAQDIVIHVGARYLQLRGWHARDRC